MHAGWSLWVAWVLLRETRSHAVHALGWAHVLATALVIVGTGNHWLLDAAAGWLVVALAAVVVRPMRRADPAPSAPLPDRLSSTSAGGSP